jgi:serine/threonine protein kinase/WD40 repeat protein
MTPEPSSFERAAELFEELLGLAPAERAQALARSRAEPEVLAQLRRMLAGAEHPCPGLDRGPSSAPTPPLPESIGGFRILRLLGEGGMGRVYEAEQQAPRRRVALKVIRGAFVSPEVLRRFENEAQVLGRLKHPGLATVYEAGSALLQGERVPYLAMELVEGEPLDVWLARARPAREERVELVALVCDAVHHAHQKGIVHRDLKPSNVLVDAAGRPRVLDFGIARITGADVEITTQHTHTGAVLGTLPYMSPEQLAGDSAQVDLRSDVYALGVLLYEVLGGRRPLDLRGKSLAEAARVVTQEEPPPLGALDARLRGDLETIAAKALAKEKERRYPSAAELAEDLRRALRDEPIVARPVTTLHQLLKFARRNRRLVAALLFGLLSLVGGLCAALVFAVRERNQRTLAEERSLELEFQIYRQGIAEAYRELRAGQQDRARELAAALPAREAGWELPHLLARLEVAADPLRGHSQTIYRLRTDRSGATLASASADGRLFLWDLAGATGAHKLDCGGQPRRVELSPDGRHVFALSWSEAERRMSTSLWEEGRLVRSEVHPSDQMGWGDTAFAASGELVAWGWKDGCVRVWEVPSARERFTVRVHASEVRALALDPRGDRLVTAGHEGDTTLKLVDLGSGAILQELPGVTAPVAELHFLGSGALFAARGTDGTLSLWDGRSGERRARLDLGENANCLASTADGARVYAGTGSGRILVLDGRTAQTLAVHGAGAPVPCLALLEESQTLAAGLQDGRIVLLECETGQLLAMFAPPGGGGSVTALLRIPGTDRIAAGYANGSMQLLSSSVRSFEVLRGHGSYVYGAVYARGGKALVSGSWDRTLRLWDAATLRPLAVWPLPERVIALHALGAEERALVALMNGEVLVLDLATGGIVWRTRVHPWDGSGAAVAASPDGKRVLVVDPGEPIARVFAAGTGALESSATWRPRVRTVALDPGGRWIAAGAPGTLSLHDARTLALQRELPVEGTPQRLAVSPDGRWLAIGSREGSIEVLDVARVTRRARFDAAHGVVYALAFHPDGTRLASGAQDGSVALWDTRTWTRILDLEAHVPIPPEPTYHYVWELAFSPDGTQLVSASGDHTLRVWAARSAATLEGAGR